jgi:hypothetical protein
MSMAGELIGSCTSYRPGATTTLSPSDAPSMALSRRQGNAIEQSPEVAVAAGFV